MYMYAVERQSVGLKVEHALTEQHLVFVFEMKSTYVPKNPLLFINTTQYGA